MVGYGIREIGGYNDGWVIGGEVMIKSRRYLRKGD